MNQLEELQSIFLKWFKHHGNRTRKQIKDNIDHLCNSYDYNGNGFFPVFFPLVRQGFIEFIGEDQYQISPPIIIHHLQSEISTGINLIEEQIDQITKNVNEFSIDPFGVIRFKFELKQIENFSNELNCAFSVPNAGYILSNFPKLSDVILSNTNSDFSKIITLDGHGFYLNLKTHKFYENKKKGSVGIFKTDKDAHKYFFFDGTDCYEIPSEKYNPDGWCIAETVQAVRENFDFLVYNERTEQLTVKSINISILIDRILRLPSIHLVDGAVSESFKTTYTHIKPSVIKQLNRIFETKIKTIHE